MNTSPLFKRAFTAGLNEELIRQGAVVYPSKEAAELASDDVADRSGMPDPISEGEKLNFKVATELCNALIANSKFLCKQAGNVYSPELSKTAANTSPQDAAIEGAWRVMEKAAAETGALLQGGDHPNELPAAAQANGEAALEMARRPVGYANLGERGVGNWEGKGQGTVGQEEKHPEAPAATGQGSNSVIETSGSKQGSLAEVVARISKKAAEGALLEGGDKANTMAAAAAHNAEAALEQKRRGEGYAVKGEDGVGRTDFSVPAGAVVGSEQKHPEAPAATGSGSNSVTKMSAFNALFEETASSVVPYLPEKMAAEQKVAHVRAMMGLDVGTRAEYLAGLYTSLGSTKEASELVKTHFIKSAGELPPALREHMFGKKDESKETPAEEKAETKEHEAKEASDISKSLNSLRAALANLKTVS